MSKEKKQKQEVPDNFMQDFLKSGGTPTTADKGSDTPTLSDIVGDTPTTADKIDLVRLTVRVDKRQRDRLERLANDQGRLLSDVVREAIREYLKHH